MKLLSIQEVANILGVSGKTLRRWEEKGILVPLRTPGNQRRYVHEQVANFRQQRAGLSKASNLQFSKSIPSQLPPQSYSDHASFLRQDSGQAEPDRTKRLLSIQEVANILGVSGKTLRRWEEKGILVPLRTRGNQRRYMRDQVDKFRQEKGILAPFQDSEPELQVVSQLFSQPTLISQEKNIIDGASNSQYWTEELVKSILVFKKLAVTAVFVMLFVSVAGVGVATLKSESLLNIAGIPKILSVLGISANKIQIPKISEVLAGKAVLGAGIKASDLVFDVNVKSRFADSAEFLDTIKVFGVATLSGGVVTENQDVNAGTGELTASNVLYGVVAGSGIAVGPGQTPTITNTGVLSLGGSTGALALTAGTGITISGLEISSTGGTTQDTFKTIAVTGSSSFDASSSTDTLTFEAGTGISLSSDSSSKKVTITGIGETLWQRNNGAISPLDITDDLLLGGISTSTAKFAFKNNAGGIPTASISAITGNSALYLTGDGSLATVNRQNLTIGNSSTYNTSGNVLINPNGTGNVGIKTTSPRSTLDVNGNINFQNSLTANPFCFGFTPCGGSLRVGVNTGGIDVYGGGDSITGAYFALRGDNYTTADQRGQAQFFSNADATAQDDGATGRGGAIFFGTYNPVNYPSIPYHVSMVITRTGDVGLGGSGWSGSGAGLPTATLDIQGGINGYNAALIVNQIGPVTNDILAASSSGTTQFRLTNNGFASASAGFTINSAGALQTTNAHQLTIGGSTTGGINFLPGNIQTLRLSKIGRVGIGTQTAPKGLLDIKGNAGNNATLIVDNTDTNASDIFTASKSGTTKLTITNKGFIDIIDGTFSTAVGYQSLRVNTADFNTAMGYHALFANTTGTNNTAVGESALTNSNTSGSFNTAVGSVALFYNNGNNNTAVGYKALVANTSGYSNTALGYNAGYTNTGQYQNQLGNNNTYLGYNAGPWADAVNDGVNFNNSTAIGAYSLVYGDNSLVLGGTAFYAVNVGIGTATPSATLDIQGGQRGGRSALIVNQIGAAANDIFTASSSGTTRFVITNSGGLGINTGANNSTLLSTLDVRPNLTNGGTLSIASVSGATSYAGLVVDNTGVGDLLTASKSGATKFTILNNGNIQLAGQTNFLTTLTSAATQARTITFPDESGTICISGGSCSAPSSGTSGYWNQSTSGTLFPGNSTVDLLVGTSTGASSSAKFGFLNVNSGTPTASISASLGDNAVFLTGAGNLATTNRQTLTLGGGDTGDINLSLAGSSNLRISGTPGVTVSGTCVNSINGIVTESVTCIGAGSTNWDVVNGVIAPKLTSILDFLLGSQSSSSAKFAVLNINGSATPVASISATTASGGSGTGLVLSGASTIQSLLNSNLTLGGSTTGGINFLPGNIQTMFLSSIGRIGMGTQTNPKGLLDIAGNSGGNAALIVNQTGSLSEDIFTASASGLAKFTIRNDGTLVSGIYTGQNAALYATQTTGVIAQATTSSSNLCLVSGASAPSWASCGSGVSSDVFWNQSAAGLLFPNNSTVDFAIGGQSSSSAKFAVLNVASGTPTATVAGNFIVMPYTSGASQLGGSVGIGTTAPNQLLHLSSSGSSAMQFTTTSFLNKRADIGYTFANDATSPAGSTAWSNPSNAQTSDNSYASINAVGAWTSNYLKATEFGFTIPTGATIKGILVEVEKRSTLGGGDVRDNSIKIVKAGSPTGTDQSAGANWSSSDTYASYGSSSDLWGTTWTASDINSSNFGVGFSALCSDGPNCITTTASVDHIRITVYYTGNDWVVGTDTQASGRFSISNSTAFGTNDYLTVDTSGNASISGSLNFATYKKLIAVFEGDSISVASGWPSYVTTTRSPYFGKATVTNFAVAGDAANTMTSEYATQGHTKRPVNNGDEGWFFFMAGTNDIGFWGFSAATTYNNLKTIWAAARADRYKVVAFTIMPSSGYSAAQENTRKQLNSLIMSDPSLYDYVIRTDIILPDPTDTTYFDYPTDGTHPNEAGQQKIADLVETTIFYKPWLLLPTTTTTNPPTLPAMTLSLNPTGGNVGVGTTSASEKLEINGNLLFTRETARTISVAASTTVNTAGAALTISAGNAFATANGGALNLNGGAASGIGATSGAINLTTSGGGSVGGAINLTTGSSGVGGGNINLTAGGETSTPIGAAGNINLTAGSATGTGISGGSISLTPGIGQSKNGSVLIGTSASGNAALVVNQTAIATGVSDIFTASSAGVTVLTITKRGFIDIIDTLSSTAVGYQALSAITSGTSNSAFGYQALTANTSGTENTAVGYRALFSNVGAGNGNTALGFGSSFSNTTGDNNVALGYQALNLNTTGDNNIAVGYQALANNTVSNNVAIGYFALTASTTGTSNTAVGHRALSSNNGSSNSAFGYQALISNTGSSNVALGDNALFSSTTGSQNTAIGAGAGLSNTTSSNNVSVGYLAGQTANQGGNVFLGSRAGQVETLGAKLYIATASATALIYGDFKQGQVGINTLLPGGTLDVQGGTWGGNAGLIVNQTGASTNDIFTASASGTTKLTITNKGFIDIIDGTSSTGVGYQALRSNTGSSNTAFGFQASYNNTTGIRNVSIGYQAAYGYAAGFLNIGSNIAIGYQSLYSNTSGANNVAIGDQALYSGGGIFAPSNSVAIGFQALYNTTGSWNTAVGYQSLLGNTTGVNNAALGSLAGYTTTAGNANTIGTQNTFLGYASGPGGTNWLTNATAIGAYSTVTCPNCLVLGSISGINTATESAKIGIGTANPQALLDIQGGKMGGGAALILNQTGASTNDIFTASASGKAKFTITNAGSVQIAAGTGISTGSGVFALNVFQLPGSEATAAAQIWNSQPNTGGTGACTNSLCHTALSLRLGTDASVGDPGNPDRFINFARGDSTIIGKVRGNGSGGVAYDTAGGDYAEWFQKESVDEHFDFGDIVCLSQNGKVVKCDSNNRNILGAITDTPGFVGNSGNDEDPSYILVGLLGQIKVKVSLENGPIKGGDIISYSTVSGTGAKAIHTGFAVARAIGSFDGTGSSRIQAYVNPTWYDPSVYLGLDGNLGGVNSPVSSEAAALALGLGGLPQTSTTIPSGSGSSTATSSSSFDLASDINFVDLKNRVASAEAQIEDLRSQIINSSTQSAFLTSISSQPAVLGASSSADFVSDLSDLDIKSANISEDLMVLGRTTTADLGVTGNIAVGLMSIHGLDESVNNGNGGATINSVGDLNLQNNGLGGVNILSGKVTIDTQGNIKTQGDITAKKINIDTAEQDSASLGSGTMIAGQSSVAIPTTAVTNKSRVFITPTTKTGNQVLAVTSKSSGSGFTVEIEQAYDTDIKFDWWIVDEE